MLVIDSLVYWSQESCRLLGVSATSKFFCKPILLLVPNTPGSQDSWCSSQWCPDSLVFSLMRESRLLSEFTTRESSLPSLFISRIK
jgi:hypothetical protein